MEILTNEEVERRREIYGRNVVEIERKITWYRVLFSALLHPFNMLLIILAVISGAMEDFDAMGIMFFMVLLSTGLRFHQEWKSARAAHSLRKLVSNKVCVLRYADSDTGKSEQNLVVENGIIESEISIEDVVPGDWVKLSAGDLIPADIQLIESKDLFVSQSSLTGEAIPVEKFVSNLYQSFMVKTQFKEPKPKRSFNSKLIRFIRNVFGLRVDLDSDMNMEMAHLDRADLCYMGTSVVSGSATAVVKKTGKDTYMGSMAEELSKRRPQNAFQLGVRRISWSFFLIMALMLPPVLLLQGFLHKDWTEAFLFALSVAVGLTPEMLPMIVNATLARGALLMSKKKCIVKTLDSIINLGGMDVLCTDKTGTLTENQVVLLRHVDCFAKTSIFPLQLACLNSHFQTGLKNLLDVAVIDFFEKESKVSPIKISMYALFEKVDEIPFDFERRRMSVILKSKNESILISKGAVDEMLDVCSHIYLGPNYSNGVLPIITDEKIQIDSEKFDYGENNNKLDIPNANHIIELTQDMIDHLKHINDALNQDGLRVIAVAFKKFSEVPKTFTRTDECKLVFAGFIGFLDPPKKSAGPAIKFLLEHNVDVKVLTGDSVVVCRKVCEQINLPISSIVTTSDLEGISDEQLAEIAEKATIFAKLTPLQKAQVIRGLKRKNHIVGFLGDGINDSPALAEADIGISVDTGTDIAKESADIILLEKDLMVISNGVIYGRRTYGNTIKYILMAVSSNFGNVFSVLVASIWLPFLPMLPIHILTQNMLYDISQISIPWDKMDPEFLMVPHRWSMKSVLRFMVWMGPWSSIFDITTFAYMYFYYGIQTKDDDVLLFQTTWFTEGLLTQTLVVHMIRTPKIPFFQSWAAPVVTFMTFLIVGICLSLPYIPSLSFWLNMVHLPGLVYPYVFAEILAYCILAQLAKVIYIKAFGKWF